MSAFLVNLFSIVASQAHANGNVVQVPNPLGDDATVTTLLLMLLDALMYFAVPLIILAIIWAGFNYVTAQGDSAKIGKATTALTYAVIGGLLIIGATVLVDIVQEVVDAIIYGR